MIIISFCIVIINIRLVYLFSLLVLVFEDDDGSDRVASRFGILICMYYGRSIQDQVFLIWLLLHIFMVDIVGCFLLLACVVFVFLGVALCLRTCCCVWLRCCAWGHRVVAVQEFQQVFKVGGLPLRCCEFWCFIC